MFSDYKLAVIKTYERKKIAGDLSLNLLKPSPAKLRDECLVVISERYEAASDERILRMFFGHQESIENYLRCIRNFDVDKFRPLVNLLKEHTENPEDKNIELLSLLIDYRPRPFQFNYGNLDKDEMNDSEDKAHAPSSLEKPEKDIAAKPAPTTLKKDSNEIKGSFSAKKLYKPLAILGLIIMIVIAIDLFSANSRVLKALHLNSPQCMYWNEDHYVGIDCNKDTTFVQVIALDEEKLNRFRKITKTDTLKADCIGKIWYSKINNEVEFFTTSGMHPIHMEKGLKLVTEHIYDTYIVNKHKSTLVHQSR